MALTKRLSGFRFAEIRQNDTLQALAQRELNDATMWTELIAINDLLPPYLTGDILEAGPNVKLFGQSLLVPAVSSRVTSASDPDRVFGADIALLGGLLSADATGDLSLVSGVANLKQAYKNRLDTPLNELTFHPTYGCGAHALKGQGGTPGTVTLAAQYVRSSLLADPRTRSVESTQATLAGDVTEVRASATAVTGSSIDIQTSG